VSRAAAPPPLRAADFERLLSTRPCARSEHFVLHHVPAPQAPRPAELSTPATADGPTGVDDLRLALIVPKRQARRAVTRTLIKRQGRAQFAAHAGRLPAGDWLLRLRSGYPPAQFPSAASLALRRAVRAELQTLFGRVAAPAPGARARPVPRRVRCSSRCAATGCS
jgi:ribonuclease P protein component